MFAAVRLDVWVAAALAVAVVWSTTFGPSTGLFLLIYFGLSAYVVVGIINDEIA